MKKMQLIAALNVLVLTLLTTNTHAAARVNVTLRGSYPSEVLNNLSQSTYVRENAGFLTPVWSFDDERVDLHESFATNGTILVLQLEGPAADLGANKIQNRINHLQDMGFTIFAIQAFREDWLPVIGGTGGPNPRDRRILSQSDVDTIRQVWNGRLFQLTGGNSVSESDRSRWDQLTNADKNWIKDNFDGVSVELHLGETGAVTTAMANVAEWCKDNNKVPHAFLGGGPIATASMSRMQNTCNSLWDKMSARGVSKAYAKMIYTRPAHWNNINLLPETNQNTFMGTTKWLMEQVNSYPMYETEFVSIRKSNQLSYALDGGNNGANNQNVKLWGYGPNNINQQWEEIPRGGNFYSYRKKGTSYSIDGGNSGSTNQNVKLYRMDASSQNQHWRKVDMGNNFYRLEKRNASNYSIDGNNGGANNQNVRLIGNSTNGNQQWRIQ